MRGRGSSGNAVFLRAGKGGGVPETGDGDDTLGSEDCLVTRPFLERGGGRGGGLRTGALTGEVIISSGLPLSAGVEDELLSLVTDSILSVDCPLPWSTDDDGLCALPFLRFGNGGGGVGRAEHADGAEPGSSNKAIRGGAVGEGRECRGGREGFTVSLESESSDTLLVDACKVMELWETARGVVKLALDGGIAGVTFSGCMRVIICRHGHAFVRLTRLSH